MSRFQRVHPILHDFMHKTWSSPIIWAWIAIWPDLQGSGPKGSAIETAFSEIIILMTPQNTLAPSNNKEMAELLEF